MKNLRNIRKEQGFTCESLGKLVNVQKSAISKYERGEIQPSQDVLVRLSEVLNCSIDYLLEKTNDPTPMTLQKKELLSNEKAVLKMQQVLVDEGIIPPKGDLTDEQTEILLNYITANASFLKKLIHDNK